MDLSLERSEVEFRDRLERWLDATPIPAGLRDYGATPTAEDIGPGREWQHRLVDGGFAALSWPTPWGAGSSVTEQAIFAESLARRHLPRQLSFVSLELAGPIIIAFGTRQQQERFLPAIRSGDELWCQLFSEPEAGSDLAALRTKATPSHDGWHVSGQKIWTSGAHYSDFGLLLARTDPAQDRHRGISCFALPLDRAGIDIRPIVQMDGEAKFNEVFLSDVELRPGDLLGELNRGWTVALSILGRERRMLGSLAIGLGGSLLELRELVEKRGSADAEFRHQWTALWIRVQLLRWTWFRLLSSSGNAQGDPAMSILKLTSSELTQSVASLAADVLDLDFVAGEEAAGWRQSFLAAHGATLAGGTSEVQRNILGERVLGLER